MNRSFQDVSDAELAVLHELWQEGKQTIRQLTEVLYPGGTASQYATVQKLLERLEGKGCVKRDRSGSVHVFEATIDRDALLGRRLQAVAESLCDGSLTPLLTHLVRNQRLSNKDREELRGLIGELEQKKKPKSKRRNR